MTARYNRQTANAAIIVAQMTTTNDSARSTFLSGLFGIYTPFLSFIGTGLESCEAFHFAYCKRMIAAANEAMKQTKKTLITLTYHKRAENA